MESFFKKYRPKNLDQMVSNKKAIMQLKRWSDNYKGKPLFISGEPGVGKTLSVHLLAKEKNWSILDTDASQIRNKEVVKNIIESAGSSAGLFSKTRLILIDEVDAISDKRGKDNDSGFFKEMSKIINNCKQPIIFIANNPYDNRKIRPIYEKCEKIKFNLPNKLSIAKYAKDICEKEDIDYDLVAIKELVEKSSNDIRALMNDLFTLSLNKKIVLEDIKSLGSRKKDEDIFKVLKKIYYPKDFYETRNVLRDTNINWEELFSWIEENTPRQYKDPENLKNAFDKIAYADFLKGRIRASNWILLKYVIDNLTIGVAYSKTKKEYFSYTPFQYPTFIRKLGSTKKRRNLEKSILNKLQEKIHASKRIILRDHLPILKMLAKTNKYDKNLIFKYNLDIDELKYLGSKINKTKYKKLVE
jgi:replication factor C large subunit